MDPKFHFLHLQFKHKHIFGSSPMNYKQNSMMNFITLITQALGGNCPQLVPQTFIEIKKKWEFSCTKCSKLDFLWVLPSLLTPFLIGPCNEISNRTTNLHMETSFLKPTLIGSIIDQIFILNQSAGKNLQVKTIVNLNIIIYKDTHVVNPKKVCLCMLRIIHKDTMIFEYSLHHYLCTKCKNLTPTTLRNYGLPYTATASPHWMSQKSQTVVALNPLPRHISLPLVSK